MRSPWPPARRPSHQEPPWHHARRRRFAPPPAPSLLPAPRRGQPARACLQPSDEANPSPGVRRVELGGTAVGGECLVGVVQVGESTQVTRPSGGLTVGSGTLGGPACQDIGEDPLGRRSTRRGPAQPRAASTPGGACDDPARVRWRGQSVRQAFQAAGLVQAAGRRWSLASGEARPAARAGRGEPGVFPRPPRLR